MFITNLFDILHSKVFRFFYSIYDYLFLPQKKFVCFPIDGKNQSSKDYFGDSIAFKEICRLLNRSNDIIENPDDMKKLNLDEIEYRNFFFKGLNFRLPNRYVYPRFIRGSKGLIISISCNEDEDSEKILTISLSDLVRKAMGDDSVDLPKNFYSNHLTNFTVKNRDFRPTLFFIHSTERKEIVERIKGMVEDVIDKVGYEKHNTIVVTHLDESNFYEGLEWLLRHQIHHNKNRLCIS